jgi:hypothetical protein
MFPDMLAAVAGVSDSQKLPESSSLSRAVEDAHVLVFMVSAPAEAEPLVIGQRLRDIVALQLEQFLSAQQVGFARAYGLYERSRRASQGFAASPGAGCRTWTS